MTYYKLVDRSTGETVSGSCHLTESEAYKEHGRALKMGLPYSIAVED